MELFRYQNPISSEQGHQSLLARRDFLSFLQSLVRIMVSKEHLNDTKTAGEAQCRCFSGNMVKLAILAQVEHYCFSISIQLAAL